MNRSIPVLLLTFLFAAAPLAAQPIWIGAQEMDGLIFEWEKPVLKHGDGVNFFHSSIFLSYRQRTSDAVIVHLELPMSNYDVRSTTQFLFGNPYIGLVLGPEDAMISGDIGVRLPVADQDKGSAAIWGALTDIDRIEAFVSNTVPVSGLFRFQTMFPRTNFGVRMHFGPSFLIHTKKSNDDVDVLLKYGLIGMYKNDEVLVQLGFSGWNDVSDDRGIYDDSSVHQLGMSVNFNTGARIWPGLLMRIPLDNHLSDVVSLVIGINFMLMI